MAAATGAAVVAGAIALIKQQQGDGYSTDFLYYWQAARVLLDGGNPYHGATPFVYPLPAAVTIAQVAWLDVGNSGILFSALSVGALAFCLTREGYWRLPLLASFPALWAVSSGQWSILVACAALTSGMGWAAACKPTLGLAMLARRLDWRGFLWAVGFGAVTLFLNPAWPWEWFQAMRGFAGEKLHHVPVMVTGGVLVLAVLWRYRDPDARLIAAMAVIPQSMFFYDQLALGLVARTFRQSLVIALLSYVVPLAGFLLAPAGLTTKAANAGYFAHVITLGYYLPIAAWVALRKAPKQEPENHALFGRR